MTMQWSNMPDGFGVIEKRDWLCRVAADNDASLGMIQFTNLDLEEIKKLNKRFLRHDYATDVITFCYGGCCEREVQFEAFISVEVIGNYARENGLREEDELDRVLVHALLHCLGYSDSSKKEREEMRRRENYYLQRRTKVSRGT